MISYERLWATLKEKGKSKRYLRKFIGGGTYANLKQNGNVSSHTLNLICHILQCKLEDIAEYIDDE